MRRYELADGTSSKFREIGIGGKTDPDDSWLFQFNEDLVEVNLGDAGTMYVFADHAYWDGH